MSFLTILFLTTFYLVAQVVAMFKCNICLAAHYFLLPPPVSGVTSANFHSSAHDQWLFHASLTVIPLFIFIIDTVPNISQKHNCFSIGERATDLAAVLERQRQSFSLVCQWGISRLGTALLDTKFGPEGKVQWLRFIIFEPSPDGWDLQWSL